MNWARWIVVFLISFSSCYGDYRYELSVCTIFQNAADNIKEWLEFHRAMGVQHFFLCSNNSHDHFHEILDPYVQEGVVDLIEFNESFGGSIAAFNQIQCGFYTNTIRQTLGVSRWVACIDSDEFLFSPTHPSLVDFLKSFDDCAGIGANWQTFGTGDVEKLQPGELIIERLLKCARSDDPVNLHIKSIVRPECVAYFENPHHAIYHPPYTQVNTDRVAFTGPFSPYIQVNQLRINHYTTGDSFHFWHNKAPRLQRWWGLSTKDLVKMCQDLNQQEDRAIFCYLPLLKKQLQLTEN